MGHPALFQRRQKAGGWDHEVRYESKKREQSASAESKAVKKVGNTRKERRKRLGRQAVLAGAGSQEPSPRPRESIRGRCRLSRPGPR
ncbi:hypothetical protein XH92_40020 [Bradyrhizobium sp. CCBAU 53421]|nr:hypothetical protein XH92_40020 [Bradyrhizobium sp. CCBAU 53421]